MRRARAHEPWLRRWSLAVAMAALAGACAAPPPSSIQVQRQMVIVDNRSADDWVDVEIWINRQYRVTTRRIAAGSRFTTTLDAFVAGFGQRFDGRRQRIDDLRLNAKTPAGAPVELGGDGRGVAALRPGNRPDYARRTAP